MRSSLLINFCEVFNKEDGRSRRDINIHNYFIHLVLLRENNSLYCEQSLSSSTSVVRVGSSVISPRSLL